MSQFFLGEIMMFAGNFAPRGFAFCNGQLLPIDQNNALFALIGTTYGGDGQTTFALPNLQSRVPIHIGQGPGLPNHVIGQNGGVEQVTLLAANLPSHTHQVMCTSNTGSQAGPVGGVWATDSSGATAEYDPPTATALAAGAIGNAGQAGPSAHNNIQPYLAIHYCIALEGIFPSQN